MRSTARYRNGCVSVDWCKSTRGGAPICRSRYENFTIDVMPTDERILGFSNHWYRPAISSAQDVR